MGLFSFPQYLFEGVNPQARLHIQQALVNCGRTVPGSTLAIVLFQAPIRHSSFPLKRSIVQANAEGKISLVFSIIVA